MEKRGWYDVVGKIVLAVVCGVLVEMHTERNLLEASEMGFFECKAMFEQRATTSDSKFVDKTASEDIMFLSAVGTNAFC